jgi:hypothetical protein
VGSGPIQPAQLLALGTAINLTFSSADAIAIVLTSALARGTRRIGLAERIIRLWWLAAGRARRRNSVRPRLIGPPGGLNRGSRPLDRRSIRDLAMV